MNSFGHTLRLTTFGESHGPAIGGVLDGMPAGLRVDPGLVQQALDRRRPGGGALGSARREPDRVQILSGIYDGLTLGTPIGFVIPNTDTRSADYERLRHLYRPNHADFTYQAKYGVRDHRGGGRASARETACRVVAGALAEQALAIHGITLCAYASAIGGVECECGRPDPSQVYASDVRCPDPRAAALMRERIQAARSAGDTVGGTVSCVVRGVPPGLGEPLFGKLQASLAAAMMSIPAAKGFEYGLGFASASALGSETADIFLPGEPVRTLANHSGGIQGGISNGGEITFRVAFKPAPTLMRPVPTIDDSGRPATLEMTGRHDPCVVPRAVPVVGAMACLVLLDAMLMHRTDRITHTGGKALH